MKILRRINMKNLRIQSILPTTNFIRRRRVHIRPSQLVEQKDNLLEAKKQFPADIESILISRSEVKATKNDLMYNGSFHEAIAPVLLIAQFFAIMPVKGLRSKTAYGLSFEWGCFLTCYSLIVFVCLVMYFGLTIYFVYTNHFKLVDIDPVVFYGSGLCAIVFFGNLARKWPTLMRRWHDVEIQLPRYQSYIQRAAMAHKIRMITLIVLVTSLIEHLLSIITGIHYTNYCNIGKDPFESFFTKHLYHIFYVTSYSAWKAIVVKILNVVATFAWSYMDLFVMVIGVGLSEKFRQVNESMLRVKGKQANEFFWHEHRQYYRNLCDLCEEIDNAVSKITMVSFSNNVYFICVQLLKSLNKMPSVGHALYFWWSMSLLVGRTIAVSLYSAEINDESKRPITIFRCVPKESWCLEVKRFSQEVNSDIVALSGMKFFHLTRGLLLSVAGTIVTYELVLFQFQRDVQIVDEC